MVTVGGRKVEVAGHPRRIHSKFGGMADSSTNGPSSLSGTRRDVVVNSRKILRHDRDTRVKDWQRDVKSLMIHNNIINPLNFNASPLCLIR